MSERCDDGDMEAKCGGWVRYDFCPFLFRFPRSLGYDVDMEDFLEESTIVEAEATVTRRRR